ncbi:hypothetical protein GCM10022378_04620 [Salinicoccus jeotgali]|uniref:Transposase DDE domain-containing protein n=1 Tax=Salinicoccus jeotgali TaxID=381634 RepID=A0ABP7ECY9_9STAP
MDAGVLTMRCGNLINEMHHNEKNLINRIEVHLKNSTFRMHLKFMSGIFLCLYYNLRMMTAYLFPVNVAGSGPFRSFLFN